MTPPPAPPWKPEPDGGPLVWRWGGEGSLVVDLPARAQRFSTDERVRIGASFALVVTALWLFVAPGGVAAALAALAWLVARATRLRMDRSPTRWVTIAVDLGVLSVVLAVGSWSVAAVASLALAVAELTWAFLAYDEMQQWTMVAFGPWGARWGRNAEQEPEQVAAGELAPRLVTASEGARLELAPGRGVPIDPDAVPHLEGLVGWLKEEAERKDRAADALDPEAWATLDSLAGRTPVQPGRSPLRQGVWTALNVVLSSFVAMVRLADFTGWEAFGLALLVFLPVSSRHAHRWFGYGNPS